MKKPSLFFFLFQIASALLAACFVFSLVPMFMDFVTDSASFGAGFMFCMFVDLLFSLCKHNLEKGFYYFQINKSATKQKETNNNDNS